MKTNLVNALTAASEQMDKLATLARVGGSSTAILTRVVELKKELTAIENECIEAVEDSFSRDKESFMAP